MKKEKNGFFLLDALYSITIILVALTLGIAYLSKSTLANLEFYHQSKVLLYKVFEYRQEKRYGYNMAYIKGNEMIFMDNHYYRGPYGSIETDMGPLIEAPFYLNRIVKLNFTHLGEYQGPSPAAKTMSFSLKQKSSPKKIDYTISVQTGRIKMKEVFYE